MRIAYDVMAGEFRRALLKYGMTPERAGLSAKLFADASLDGVYTHGLNRFPKFIKSVQQGCVDIQAVPVCTERAGALERWDGRKGPGNLNAYFCMEQAIRLARLHEIGCVALSNTNHWMRPGNYGLMAADHNCIGVLWTNTVPNMPAWGGKDPKLGNNPLVVAIPHKGGHILLDIAMSMFSYGKLESYARQKRELPVEGGFDRQGKPTRNPSEVLATHQPMPIGYWKGSGLSLALDLTAAVLANGRSSRKIGQLPHETELSQVFLAHGEQTARTIADTLADMEVSEPMQPGATVHYPGEGMRRTREDNRLHGIPVDESVWKAVQAL